MPCSALGPLLNVYVGPDHAAQARADANLHASSLSSAKVAAMAVGVAAMAVVMLLAAAAMAAAGCKRTVPQVVQPPKGTQRLHPPHHSIRVMRSVHVRPAAAAVTASARQVVAAPAAIAYRER